MVGFCYERKFIDDDDGSSFTVLLPDRGDGGLPIRKERSLFRPTTMGASI